MIYIIYCLAKEKENDEKAWNNYIHIYYFGYNICTVRLTFVQYILLESELNQIVSSSSKEATDEISFEVDTDVVSVSLGIITAGIGFFALFGGILSIFNIKQSKELDIAISDAREALENQYEL